MPDREAEAKAHCITKGEASMSEKPSEPDPGVLPLRDMVTRQAGAIVSRTLLSRPSSTITLFAFDEDQELSQHTTPFDAMAQILDGTARVTISGTPYDLEAGSAIIMPANQPHAVKATSSFKMLLTMIRG